MQFALIFAKKTVILNRPYAALPTITILRVKFWQNIIGCPLPGKNALSIHRDSFTAAGGGKSSYKIPSGNPLYGKPERV